MFDSRTSDTEDKLILLSMIDGLGGCTQEQLMRFALEAGLMPQFRFLLALGDLREDGLVREIRNAEGRVLVLEPEGRQTLNLFGDRIRPSAQERLKENAPRWRARFRDERQLPAEWQQTDEGFLVTLRALEAGQETLRIQLTAVNREEAQRFCARWPKQAVSVYGALIHALAGEEET